MFTNLKYYSLPRKKIELTENKIQIVSKLYKNRRNTNKIMDMNVRTFIFNIASRKICLLAPLNKIFYRRHYIINCDAILFDIFVSSWFSDTNVLSVSELVKFLTSMLITNVEVANSQLILFCIVIDFILK